MDKEISVKQLTGLDIFRFAASVCVVMIHSFMQYENFFDAYIVRIFVRWAVPFFFMVSGYFLKDDSKDLLKYLLHIFVQYLFWTLFYSIVFKYDIWSVKNFLSALRSGIIMPFWYFPSLMLCITLVWFLFKTVKKPMWVLLICSVLFVYALIGHTFINVPAFDFINNGHIMKLHHRVIGEVTTRDGIFWGSLFIAIGKTLNTYKESSRLIINNRKKHIALLVIFFILAAIEEVSAVYFNTGEKDILIFTVPFVTLLFIYALNIRINEQAGVFLRTMSTGIFLTHYYFLELFMRKHILSFPLFILTLVCSLAVSFVFTWLAGKYKAVKYIV